MLKALVVSIPKSGTNLVASVIARMPLMRFQKITLNRNLRRHPLAWLPGKRCLVGVHQPQSVPVSLVRMQLYRLGLGRFTSSHLPWHPEIADALYRQDTSAVFISRDPRDVVVSNLHHILRRPRHFLHATLKALPDDSARIEALIVGTDHCVGIAEQLRLTEGWRSDPDTLSLDFADLIGPQGGGGRDAQIHSIAAIARHIGADISEDDAARIGQEMFGTGSTFRRGAIGGWKEHFTDRLEAVFDRAMAA